MSRAKKPSRKTAETAAAFKKAMRPNIALLSKLGSLIVHADECLSPDGRDLDRTTFYDLLANPDVQEWMKAMGPLLPLKRVVR